MNRIILIGNGFDLAHGLKTKYNDFIDNYWDIKTELFKENYNEGKLIFRTQGTEPIFDYKDNDIIITNLKYSHSLNNFDKTDKKGYEKFKYMTMRIPAKQERTFSFSNVFLE